MMVTRWGVVPVVDTVSGSNWGVGAADSYYAKRLIISIIVLSHKQRRHILDHQMTEPK